MKKISPAKRKIIEVLLLISGICTGISKKLSKDYSGFVFALPIPGWWFIVDTFCQNTYISGIVHYKKVTLKNVIEKKVWQMPQEWKDDLEQLKRGNA